MLLRPLEDVADISSFGGKATELGVAIRAGLPVPNGIAVSHEFVADLVENQADEAVLVDRVRDVPGPYVVRSSAVGEDSAEASFAGQHSSVINVQDPAAVPKALAKVYESGQSEAVMEYRAEVGIEESPKMAAVVQTMIGADKAGVLFSQNPVTGEDERVIESSWGLGEAVVDSLVTPDYFRVNPAGEVLERRPGSKDVAVWPASNGGTKTESVPDEKRNELSLTDSELQALADLADRCDTYRSGEHDIEWAIDDDSLYLLQRRAITTS